MSEKDPARLAAEAFSAEMAIIAGDGEVAFAKYREAYTDELADIIRKHYAKHMAEAECEICRMDGVTGSLATFCGDHYGMIVREHAQMEDEIERLRKVVAAADAMRERFGPLTPDPHAANIRDAYDAERLSQNVHTSEQVQTKRNSEPPTWGEIATMQSMSIPVVYYPHGVVGVGVAQYKSDIEARRAIAKEVGL